MTSWFSSAPGVIYGVVLIAAAVLAHAVRDRLVLAGVVLLLGPALSAGVWLVGTDGSGLDADETVFRYVLVVVTSYASVWLGMAAGLLSDRFAAAGSR